MLFIDWTEVLIGGNGTVHGTVVARYVSSLRGQAQVGQGLSGEPLLWAAARCQGDSDTCDLEQRNAS